jgi:hypothetical protein
MKTIFTYKAQATIPEEPIEGMMIDINAEIPNIKGLHEWEMVMGKEAAALENALYFSLPGGIYDRLLGVMLERKSSHFRVAHQ